MSEKPMLFSTEMVKAILDGRKTQTRRVIKPQPCPEATEFSRFIHFADAGWEARFSSKLSNAICGRKPNYFDGDILWVRETWNEGHDGYVHKADAPSDVFDDTFKWRPSIHMPRTAARVFLRVTGVRAERVHDISEEDAKAEGISRIFDNLSKQQYDEWNMRGHLYSGVPLQPPQDQQPYTNYLWHGHFGQFGMGNKQSDSWEYQYSGYDKAVDSFSSLWELINAKRGYGWDTNPWVFVYSFEREGK